MNNITGRVVDAFKFWGYIVGTVLILVALAMGAVAVLGADSTPGGGTPTPATSSR